MGACVFSPVDVYLGRTNAVQPDIVFITKENLPIIKDGKVKGAPDLVVELLSVNKKHDLQLKKNLYETYGVKEYFIVNPADKEVIMYYFDGRKFLLQESKKERSGRNCSAKPFHFSALVRFCTIFAREPEQAAAEIPAAYPGRFRR